MSSDELFENPAKVMTEWSAWLGLRSFDWQSANYELVLPSREKNVTKGWMSDTEEQLLDNFFAPYNQELFNLIGKVFSGWDKASRASALEKRKHLQVKHKN
jgi:hypothetical protein